MSEFYEVLPHIEDNDVTLSASFTADNGIRLQLLDQASDDEDWRVFDFTEEEAELIGQALVRWAQRSRAEDELVRCIDGMSTEQRKEVLRSELDRLAGDDSSPK